MGKHSGIEWTHHTFNPWWGCEKVSGACKFCYAETFSDTRLGLSHWGPDAPRRFFGAKHWQEPLRIAEALRSARAAQGSSKVGRERMFCASMGDICEKRPDLIEPRQWVWSLAERTGDVMDWLFLTKRPENAPEMMPEAWRRNPPPYAWWMATAETQALAIERAAYLEAIPAAVRGLSMEPLLERVSIRDILKRGLIHWIIAGGESGGPEARAAHPDWYRLLRDECAEFGVAFFFKQWGQWLDLSPEIGSERFHKAAEDRIILPSGEIIGAGNRHPGGIARGAVREDWKERGAAWLGRFPHKKMTGSQLDGREHKEFPRAA